MDLDSSLGGNGEIIVMTVKAAYFDILFNPDSMKPDEVQNRLFTFGPQYCNPAYIFILMSRWIAYLGLSMMDWLNETRALTTEESLPAYL